MKPSQPPSGSTLAVTQNVVVFCALAAIGYFFWVSRDWSEDEEELGFE